MFSILGNRRNSDPGLADESMLDLSSNPSFPNGNSSPQQKVVLDSFNSECEESNNSPCQGVMSDSDMMKEQLITTRNQRKRSQV